MVAKQFEQTHGQVYKQKLKGIWKHVLSDMPKTMTVDVRKNKQMDLKNCRLVCFPLLNNGSFAILRAECWAR